MKYGIILGSPTLAELLQTAVRAEAAGFESVWTTEFFNSHGLVRLGAVAGVTDRVKLGTAISYIFMRSPMLAASAAMDIDELSGGRMILGLGSGTKRMNEDWYSMSFDGAPAPRFEDAIGLIRAAFAAQHGGGLHYSGPHYSVKIPLYSRPNAAREQIPVCLAAVNKGMIRAAARTGDGLIGHPVFTRDWIKNTVNPALQGSKCKLYPYVMTSIADSTEQARAEAKAQIGFYYTTRLYHSILEPLGWVGHGENCANAFRRGDFKGVVDAVTDEMVDAIAITGTPDAVRDQLKQWDGLADEVILYPPSIGIAPGRVQENLDAMIETFASRT
ncbi:MAG: LLM class flavin-dependent oxidoreductase [Halioglobus sp.]|jgi:alkanesulfonate monooxygenase SsuD/methylene tetrahydromethanopterin reductase-like flavin-dependent oxidoreductase (luciferase family)|nr:LLM class flavin-dependent oxidoreductase [Halioglobus sp.]